MSETIRYDFTRPYAQTGYNAGCPPGYFAQFVADDQENAARGPGFPDVAVRCRLLPAAHDETAHQQIVDESGVSLTETLTNLQQAAKDTIPQAWGNIQSLVMWAGVAVAVYVFGPTLIQLMGKRR